MTASEARHSAGATALSSYSREVFGGVTRVTTSGPSPPSCAAGWESRTVSVQTVTSGPPSRICQDFVIERLHADDSIGQQRCSFEFRMIDEHLARIGLRALSVPVGEVGM